MASTLATCTSEPQAPVLVPFFLFLFFLDQSLNPDFGNYTWASAKLLAARLAFEVETRQLDLSDAHVLELGCGTALPGLLAASCGAPSVFLTDAEAQLQDADGLARLQYVIRPSPLHRSRSCHLLVIFSTTLQRSHLSLFSRRAAAMNQVAERVTILPWTWGQWTDQILALPAISLILAADCLYALQGLQPGLHKCKAMRTRMRLSVSWPLAFLSA